VLISTLHTLLKSIAAVRAKEISDDYYIPKQLAVRGLHRTRNTETKKKGKVTIDVSVLTPNKPSNRLEVISRLEKDIIEQHEGNTFEELSSMTHSDAHDWVSTISIKEVAVFRKEFSAKLAKCWDTVNRFTAPLTARSKLFRDIASREFRENNLSKSVLDKVLNFLSNKHLTDEERLILLPIKIFEKCDTEILQGSGITIQIMSLLSSAIQKKTKIDLDAIGELKTSPLHMECIRWGVYDLLDKQITKQRRTETYKSKQPSDQSGVNEFIKLTTDDFKISSLAPNLGAREIDDIIIEAKEMISFDRLDNDFLKQINDYVGSWEKDQRTTKWSLEDTLSFLQNNPDRYDVISYLTGHILKTRR
jgi:hypothetical protein